MSNNAGGKVKSFCNWNVHYLGTYSIINNTDCKMRWLPAVFERKILKLKHSIAILWLLIYRVAVKYLTPP